MLSLNRRDGNSVDDVFHGTTATEVVHRLVEALKNGTDGNGTGFPLDGLVGVVSRVEVGKDENRRPARHLGVGHLGGRQW